MLQEDELALYLRKFDGIYTVSYMSHPDSRHQSNKSYIVLIESSSASLAHRDARGSNVCELDPSWRQGLVITRLRNITPSLAFVVPTKVTRTDDDPGRLRIGVVVSQYRIVPVIVLPGLLELPPRVVIPWLGSPVFEG